MRTVLLIVLGSLAAFLVGLAGTYFVLPMVAPDVAEAQRVRADSLARLDSVAFIPDAPLVADSSADATLPVVDSTRTPVALPDSLDALQQRLEAYEAQIDAFEAQISAYEAQISQTTAQRAQASDLAGTLIKLEDRELSQILRNLDLDVLELLYAESSARNRARLLGALAPDRTAAFIRRATTSDAAPSPPSLPAESEPMESEADASTPR